MNFELNSRTIISILTLVVISFFLIFPFPEIIESDNTLHIAYADLYRQHGLTFNDFTWQTNSILSVYKSDMWYGFHLLLLPFLVGDDFMLSVQLATFFISTVLFIIFYLVLSNIGVKRPLFWTLLFIFSSPTELYRLFDLRPHLVILITSLLFTYFLVWDKKRKNIFLISALMVFMEVSMLWIPLLFISLNFISNGLLEIYKNKNYIEVIKRYFIDTVVIISGLVIGVFLRPGAVDGVKLFYYQIVYLYYVKLSGVALPWGLELYKLKEFYNSAYIFGLVLIFFATIFYFIQLSAIKNKPSSALIRFSLACSGFFTFVLIFISSRGSDLFMLFAFISASLVYTESQDFIPIGIRKNFLVKFLVAICIFCIFSSSLYKFMFYRNEFGQTIDLYKNTAGFLQSNTPRNSIVAYMFFDQYPGLFLWNKSNRYLGHSDPIFQYSYNPDVYVRYICSFVKIDGNRDFFNERFYESFNLQNCPEGSSDLISILKDEMRADYFFINIYKQYYLVRYFIRDKRSELIYHDKASIIFRLN